MAFGAALSREGNVAPGKVWWRSASRSACVGAHQEPKAPVHIELLSLAVITTDCCWKLGPIDTLMSKTLFLALVVAVKAREIVFVFDTRFWQLVPWSTRRQRDSHERLARSICPLIPINQRAGRH